MKRLAVAVALLSGSLVGLSAAGAADPHIQIVAYQPDQLLTLSVSPGFAAVVELSPDERVESVVVGDSAAWVVTASKRGDRVVVKPLVDGVTTNMVIITEQRRYVFLLQPASSQVPSPFVVRFTYPVQASPVAGVQTVATYRFSGARELFPIAMSDDGKRTTITWNRDTALPAVFSVEKEREGIVNGRMVGGDFVVETVASRFLFRLGSARAVAMRRPIKATR